MSYLYCVINHYPTDSFVASVHVTEEEAIAFCNKYYDVKQENKYWTKWGSFIFIDEVEFKGNIVNE